MGYTFFFPTQVVVSTDAAEDLIRLLSDQGNVSVLFLTDAGILKAGIADAILKRLEDAGVKASVFSDIPGNPNVGDVNKGVVEAAKNPPTHIVALGGGSVIDTAKATAILLNNPGLDWEDLQWGRDKIKANPLPVIVIPTTAGTGSEATHVAVIGDHTDFKKGVVHPLVFPKVAILDGGLAASLPAHLTAATGMDALVHSIEAYLGKRANPITDHFALASIKDVVRWLPEATHNGKNLEARRAMALAATQGGIAMDQAGLGLDHALCGPLAAEYHLHHGLGVAVLLPLTLTFDAPAIPPERWEELRNALGLPTGATPDVLPGWAKDFLVKLGLPTTLSAVGVRREDLQKIAEDSTRMAMFGNNIRQATAEECIALLESAL